MSTETRWDHPVAARAPDTPSVADLAGVTLDAVRMWPPRYLCSILGLPRTWIPPYRRYSEFKVLDLWRPVRTLRTLLNVTVPSVPRTPPTFGPPVLNQLFWQPSVILQRPDHNGSYTTFPQEQWFFLNGIMTNDVVAQLNAAYLAHLFHRPITLVQNSTDSMVVDLLQCALGKEWRHTTEPATKAFPAIYDALKSRHKERVVVIAHSQGTIIMANVLRMLYAVTERFVMAELMEEVVRPAAAAYAGPEFVYPDQMPLELNDFAPLDPDELAKLEVYFFATCANTVHYFRSPDQGIIPIPWIEHFGNEHDLVARLGMQAPRARERYVDIQGPRYVRPGGWGHLLTEHYLFPVEDAQKMGRRRGGRGGAAPFEPQAPESAAVTPRLYRYINGGE